MKKYTFSFIGRQTGAIGVTYPIRDTYKANDVHEAISLLYEDYEHFRELSIMEGSKIIEQPKVIKWVNVRSNQERERDPKNGSYRYNRSDSPTA